MRLPYGLGRRIAGGDLIVHQCLNGPARESCVKPGERGFSLIEMIIGMALMTELMILGYVVFDVNTKVARVQTDVAEMQQSQRVANYDLLRTLRMAGRGGVAPTVRVPWTAASMS